jgi:hypothetical protein
VQRKEESTRRDRGRKEKRVEVGKKRNEGSKRERIGN